MKPGIIVFIFCIIGILFHAQDIHAETMGEVTTSEGSSLNVRDAPNDTAPVIGSLEYGERVEYRMVNGGWGQITYNGRLGYVSTSYLSALNGNTKGNSEASGPSDSDGHVSQTSGSIQSIVLDPGHGGHDPGASGNNLMEKDIVLDVAKKVQAELEKAGFNVHMTREEDVFVSLPERVQIANQSDANLFVGIHANASNIATVRGIETHYHHTDGRNFASDFHNQISEETETMDRGVFENDFYVLRNTTMPSVLVELGFVTNIEDADLLQMDSHRNRISTDIVSAIKEL